MTISKFRNIPYPYANQNDTFIARGYHLNELVDEINKLTAGVPVEIPISGNLEVELGEARFIDAAFIDYKAIFPTAPSNINQVGEVQVNNDYNHSSEPSITWSRESTNPNIGSEEGATFEFVVIDSKLVFRITNTTSYPMEFTFTVKLVQYAG